MMRIIRAVKIVPVLCLILFTDLEFVIVQLYFPWLAPVIMEESD